MTPPAIGEGLAAIETLATFASHRISFDRDDSDSFAVTLDRLPAASGRELRKDDILPLLPRGSRWNAAVGWRSFVVLPFELRGVCAAAVGIEGVMPHASRGAFPIMRAFLLRAEEVSPALVRLAARLAAHRHGDGEQTETVAALFTQRCLVWSSDARSPGEHQSYEAPMLIATAEAWRRGQPKLLRTVVLSDDQVPHAGPWTETLRAMTEGEGRQSHLVATVPAVRAQFSRSTKLGLLWKQLLE